jgi:DNA-binding transcriptional MerR regulator
VAGQRNGERGPAGGNPALENGRLPKGRPVAIPRVPDSPRYAMSDLEAETGFNARTIRFYISEGMLAPAHGRGPSATYDKDHLLRLQFIRQLKEEFLPLDEIKERLGEMSTSDLEAHFAIDPGPSEHRWRRVAFSPDLELHIRDRGTRDYAFERAVEQIIQHARFVLEHLEAER